MRYTNKSALRMAAAVLALGTISSVSLHAEDAKPADGAMADQLDPNAKDVDQKVLKENAAVKVEDGKYKDKDGDPTFHVTDSGKKVDWFTYSGYRRYHSECHVCHGPDAMGSTYAPALKDSLKHLKARAAGAWGRARPGAHEEKPDSAKKTEKDCLGG